MSGFDDELHFATRRHRLWQNAFQIRQFVVMSLRIKQKAFRLAWSMALLLLSRKRCIQLKNFMNAINVIAAARPKPNHIPSKTTVILPPIGLATLFVGVATMISPVIAGGIYRDGAGARALSLGGASVGKPDAALEALQSNPAGLSAIKHTQLQLGLGAALANGKFSNSANPDADLKNGFGVWPEAAIAFPLGATPVTLGLGFVPDAALGGEWNYVDAPGGINNTTYGFQEHRSEITALRTTLAASVEITETLSFGAGVGLVYNRNQLHAPYIFQTYPALQGFKTLLDLKTDGFGANGTFGLLYRPSEKISIGLSYQTSTHINSDGDANGNAGVQLANMGLGGAQPDFHYNAEVDNVFPQMISAGLSWQITDRLRGLCQVDWINWADSFDELVIRLKNGSNNDINGVLGTADIYDVVPLRWEDQFVYRVGVEFQATDAIALRAGYTYGKSPVPDSTLTPLTAAVMEHKLGGGVGWKNDRYFVAPENHL